MADAITSVPVWSDHLSEWGATFCEYDYVAAAGSASAKRYSGLDLETLTIKVSNRRAAVIESQVKPMSVRMQQRNDELDLLSAALGDMAGFSALFVSKDGGDVPESVVSNLTAEGLLGLALIGITETSGHKALELGSNKLTKSDVDTWTQKLQGATDSRNNDAQRDMTRIQSLVDRRDDAYKMSSTLAEKIATTRSTTIKNV